VAPHVGRGGWTWYTGSAAWMQRAGVEGILGIRLEGDTLRVNPCIPKGWTGFDVSLRHGASRYDICVENPSGVERGVVSVSVDGDDIHGIPAILQLCADGRTRRVAVRMG
jgi:cyclic beta-1,2-glucan synthetase